jgi:ribosomal-protein-alanine N-acetyltransferase
MRKIESGSSLKADLRIAKKEDFEALFDLEKLCFKEETFNKSQLRYLLLKARSLVLVASIDGRIIGSMIVLLRNTISHARIYSLNVHPDFRRKGMASQLMDTSLEFLKNRGYKKLTLEVGITNKAAQNLYLSKGFSVDKVLKKYYKNGDDALHLIKDL